MNMVTTRAHLAGSALLLMTLTGCTDSATPPPSSAPAEDVDLTGQWQLQDADIDGREFSIPEDVHVTFVARSRATQADVICEMLSLLPPRVDGSQVELSPKGRAGYMRSCLPFQEPSSLPAKDYFQALTSVDRAERTGSTLTLTGPEIVLKYERAH